MANVSVHKATREDMEAVWMDLDPLTAEELRHSNADYDCVMAHTYSDYAFVAKADGVPFLAFGAQADEWILDIWMFNTTQSKKYGKTILGTGRAFIELLAAKHWPAIPTALVWDKHGPGLALDRAFGFVETGVVFLLNGERFLNLEWRPQRKINSNIIVRGFIEWESRRQSS